MERREENADYLYQPFTLSVDVPAYTSYTVYFSVTPSHKCNSKGGVHYHKCSRCDQRADETEHTWAVGSGVITGKDGNRLDPKGLASRAEAAAMLTRFLK